MTINCIEKGKSTLNTTENRLETCQIVKYRLRSCLKMIFSAFLLSSMLCCSKKNTQQSHTTAPTSISGLRERTYHSNITFEKQLQGTEKYQADLVSYYSDSLKVYALINTPTSAEPAKGFPTIIFGHGFHPEPKQYGISKKTGKSWRPGDYYRGLPEAYAERGFLVITPDYRGHNISQGFEYTQTSYLASTYYAIDVLHLLAALSDLKNVSLDNIFYVGHSMGGYVGLKMLLATDKIRAASLWSAVSATVFEQAIRSRDEDDEKVTPQIMSTYMSSFEVVIQNLDFSYDMSSGDPIHFISEITTPLIVHHARWERAVPYRWSESLVSKLFKHRKAFEFYSYNSQNHLFKDENKLKAITRDITFFNQKMQ